MSGEATEEEVLGNESARQIMSMMDKLQNDLKTESRTAKLWISYLLQCQMMRLFMGPMKGGW